MMLITPLQSAVYFGTSLVPLQTVDALNVSPVGELLDSPLSTGIAFYITGFLLLTAWENAVVPALQLRSILPDIPLLPGQLTQTEKAVAWITPLTANLQTPPPTKETLKKRGNHMVGSRGDVRQFITLETRDIQKGVCEVSREWSEYYKDTVTIFKERTQ